MNQLIGTVFTGLVTDENEKAYFVQKNGWTFKLSKEEGEHHLGEAVEGFGYHNLNQDLIFTTKLPKILQGKYDFGEVMAVRRDLGVFVDIGLPDKEVVVSMDELPEMRELWPKKGDQLLVTLRVDDKERMWGVLAEEHEFKVRSRKANVQTMKNKNVTGIAYRLKLVGTYVLTDDFYLGFIHPSERDQEPRLGQKIEGRVIGVNQEGILNLSLKPRAHEVISDDAAMLLTFLNKAENHRLPYTDKSAPDEIQRQFAISKGQFKRAVGSLMKQRLVEQKDGWLIQKTENSN